MAKQSTSEDEERRIALYTAFLEVTQGPEERMPWDIKCLTEDLGHEAQEKVAGMFMYMDDDGEGEFILMRSVGGEDVDYLSFATALYTLDPLHPQLEQAMRERDSELRRAGQITFDDNLAPLEAGEVFVQAASRMPTNRDIALPLACVWLITGVTLRRHADFWCYKGVPMQMAWDYFRRCVVRGAIGI